MLRALRWALLWAALILVLCLMPGRALPAWHWADLLSVDKAVHAALFAVLAILVLRALEAQQLDLDRGALAAALILCVAYGGGLELLQMLSALGRRGDWNDFIANSVGVALGWILHRRLRIGRRHGGEAVSS